MAPSPLATEDTHEHKLHNYLLAFEKRIVSLEKAKSSTDKQIEGLKKVCRL